MNLDNNIFSMKDPKSDLIAFDDNTIDLVVTAPPTFTMKGKEKFYNNTSYSWESFEDYIDYMGMVFTEVYRVLKNQHYCVITVGDDSTLVGERPQEKKTYPLAAHFINLLEWIGFTYVSEYIIDAGRKVLPNRLQNAYYPFAVTPDSGIKHVIVFIKKDNTKLSVHCPVCGTGDVGSWGYTDKGEKKWTCKNRKCSRFGFGVGYVFTEYGAIAYTHKTDKNIIPPEIVEKWSRGVVQVAPQFGDEENRRYLPAEVAEMAMLFYSGVGDVVLDPFSGAGFTILTAIKYDRKYICFERDKHDRQLFYKNLLDTRKNIEKAKSEITEAVKK